MELPTLEDFIRSLIEQRLKARKSIGLEENQQMFMPSITGQDALNEYLYGGSPMNMGYNTPRAVSLEKYLGL